MNCWFHIHCELCCSYQLSESQITFSNGLNEVWKSFHHLNLLFSQRCTPPSIQSKSHTLHAHLNKYQVGDDINDTTGSGNLSQERHACSREACLTPGKDNREQTFVSLTDSDETRTGEREAHTHYSAHFLSVYNGKLCFHAIQHSSHSSAPIIPPDESHCEIGHLPSRPWHHEFLCSRLLSSHTHKRFIQNSGLGSNVENMICLFFYVPHL